MKTSGKTNKRVIKLLYRSLDTELSQRKKQKLEKELEKSEDLRREKELILERHKALSESAASSFRPQFANRVMIKIAAIGDSRETQESFYDALLYGFKRLAVVGALVLIGLILFNIIEGQVIPIDEAFFASDLVMEQILNLPLF
jgi:hypothetical protein